MGQTPSDRLETVADVAAAIEAAGNEINDLCVTVDDDGGHGTAQVSLPIHDEGVDTACEFDLVGATLTDSTLQIELEVGTETLETTRDETTPPAAVTTELPDEDGAGHPAGADGSTPSGETPSADSDSTRSEDADSPAGSTDAEPAPAEPDSTQSEAEGAAEPAPKEAAADSDASVDKDRPAYRDPDELAAVYDPEATFPEMTDALGVDVTPQTVRKYMIKHGLHEPTSRTSETLAEADSDAAKVQTSETPPDDAEPTKREAHSPPTNTASSDEEHTQQSGGDAEVDEADEPTVDDTTGTDAPNEADTATEPGRPAADDATPDAQTSDDTATTTPQASDPPGDDAPTDTPADSPNESTDNSATTSTATDGGRQPTLAAVDSVDLPDDVSVSDLVAVLTESRTVYEVRRGLGVDDSQVRTILRRYDLIDLVTGRITQGADPPDKQEVLSRLIEASN